VRQHAQRSRQLRRVRGQVRRRVAVLRWYEVRDAHVHRADPVPEPVLLRGVLQAGTDLLRGAGRGADARAEVYGSHAFGDGPGRLAALQMTVILREEVPCEPSRFLCWSSPPSERAARRTISSSPGQGDPPGRA